jgi:hypothetical protein
MRAAMAGVLPAGVLLTDSKLVPLAEHPVLIY